MRKYTRYREVNITPQQRDFVNGYILTGKVKESAIKAGYKEKSASMVANNVLKKPHVRKYLEQQLQQVNLAFARYVNKAIKKIVHLMEHADKDSVKLQAAIEILEGAGLRKGISSAPFVNVTNFYEQYSLQELESKARSLLVSEGESSGEDKPLLSDNENIGIQGPDTGIT